MNTDPFVKVNHTEILIHELESRLPNSALVLNMALTHSKFKEEMSFYTLNGDSSSNCWILGKYEREDTGQQLTLSQPTDLKYPELDPAIMKGFRTTSVIDWDSSFEFVGIDRTISHMISDISTDVMGNITEIVPCNFYYWKPSESPRIAVEDVETYSTPTAKYAKNGLQLQTLNSKAGIEFLCNVWPYVNENSREFRTKNVQRLPSVGVFIDEEVVCGSLVNPTGHMGIVTDGSFRGRGYGTVCFKQLTNAVLEETELIPCSMVHIKNKASHLLQLRVGFQISHLCDFIFYRK